MENHILQVMKEAALAGAAAIKAEKAATITKTEKSPGEFVTNCDLASEKAIIGVLRGHYPKSSVLSEEAGRLEGDGLMWVIDPLDGTHNFMFGLPIYGLSIAAYENEKVVAGVIHIPEFNATYYASLGGGAFLNKEKITVSNRNKLGESMVMYSNRFYKHKDAVRQLDALARKCFTVRVYGSAVFDLASVASGVIDARIFHNTKPVDFAAGALIVEEAGGEITGFSGEKCTFGTADIVASNGKIHKELCALLCEGGE